MRLTPGLLGSLALLALLACQSDSSLRRDRRPVPAAEVATKPAAPTDSRAGLQADGTSAGRQVANDAPATGGPEQSDAAAKPERMLICTGELRVEVARPDETMASFQSQVADWGGYLQRQEDRTLVVRLPAARFDAAFEWVRQSGRLLSESRQALDVTEEYLDLDMRLENARRSRDRLLEILQRATAVEDILKVESELRRLTEEIERMEGRKKYLADQVAMATLAATFQPVADGPTAARARRPSRFDWINRVGAERVMEDF